MRQLSTCLLVVLLVSGTMAGDRYVRAKQGSVPVYLNEIRPLYAVPLFTAGQDVSLLVVGEGKRNLKVKAVDGRTGWVESELVVTCNPSRLFTYDATAVMSDLNNPTLVFVPGISPSLDSTIVLDRSFKEALSVNVDKETVVLQSRGR
jgi:hypothetical protein